MLATVLFAAALHIPLPAGFRPSAIAASGDLIAVCGESGKLIVLAGLKNVPQTATCGANPVSMVAFPGHLAVANHETDYITLLTNDGKGRFTSQQIKVRSKPHPHTIAAADINGDRLVDLITDSTAENRLVVMLGDRWRPAPPMDVKRKAYFNLVAADLDGDGNVDLAMPNAGFDSVSIFFGNGKGDFTPAPQSPITAGPTPFHIALGDVNGDKRPDIIVANYSGHSNDTARDGLTWIRNDGKRRFTAFPQRMMSARASSRIASGDVNGDGFADAVIIDAGGDRALIAYGSFNGLRPGPAVPTMRSPHLVAVADLDGDGRAEILVITEGVDELLVTSAPR